MLWMVAATVASTRAVNGSKSGLVSEGMDSVSAALRVVTLQSWLSILAVVSVFGVGPAGIVLLRRWTRHRPRWEVAVVWLSGCSGLLVYTAAAFVFGVCWGGEIGESGKRRLARAYGAPVVVALTRYQSDNGQYPKALIELVPKYLSGVDLRAPDASVLRYPFEYRVDTAGYELLVRYTGPGMNECRYTPARRWHCGGYF